MMPRLFLTRVLKSIAPHLHVRDRRIRHLMVRPMRVGPLQQKRGECSSSLAGSRTLYSSRIGRNQ